MYTISITEEACYVYDEDNVPILQIPFAIIKSVLDKVIDTDIMTSLQSHKKDIAEGDYTSIYEAMINSGRFIDAVKMHRAFNDKSTPRESFDAILALESKISRNG